MRIKRHRSDYCIMMGYSDEGDMDTIRDWLHNASDFDCSVYARPFLNLLDIDLKSIAGQMMRYRNTISLSSCVIVLSDLYPEFHQWIDYMIDTAIEIGRPIIGINPRGQEEIPVKVSSNATTMIEWESSSIVEAIKTYGRKRNP